MTVWLILGHLHLSVALGRSVRASMKQFENQGPHPPSVGFLSTSGPHSAFFWFFFFFLHSFSSWYMKASGTMPGLPWWLSAKEFTCQCRRHRFDPLARKIPWRKKWQPTLVFLLGKSHGLQSMGLQRVGHNLATQQQQYNAWREACSQ